MSCIFINFFHAVNAFFLKNLNSETQFQNAYLFNELYYTLLRIVLYLSLRFAQEDCFRGSFKTVFLFLGSNLL